MVKRMKIYISIPLYVTNELHADFARQTIDSITSSHGHQIRLGLVENTEDAAKNLYFAPRFRQGTNLDITPNDNNVSKAWNIGIQLGMDWGADYIIVPNADIVFNKQCIDNLVLFAQEHPGFVMWTASDWANLRTIQSPDMDNNFDEHPHFSCYMVDKTFFNKVGKFDENFSPAYFEDNDMHHRILVGGYTAAKTGSAKFYHYGSRTIKSDDELNKKNGVTYEKNRQYFKSKWGYDPHGAALSNAERLEVGYAHPFNDESKSIRDW